MYYQVQVKCGHVGRNNYIVKTLYIKASSGKEAAFIARYVPRVKHDRKDAILNVDEISYEEFLGGNAKNSADKYFLVKNSTEQRLTAAVSKDEIQKEPIRKDIRKKRNVEFIIKRQRIMEKHYDKMLLEAVNG